MIPSRFFYILCGTCVEIALLAACIHNLVVLPAFGVAMGLYYYAEYLRSKENGELHNEGQR